MSETLWTLLDCSIDIYMYICIYTYIHMYIHSLSLSLFLICQPGVEISNSCVSCWINSQWYQEKVWTGACHWSGVTLKGSHLSLIRVHETCDFDYAMCRQLQLVQLHSFSLWFCNLRPGQTLESTSIQPWETIQRSELTDLKKTCSKGLARLELPHFQVWHGLTFDILW